MTIRVEILEAIYRKGNYIEAAIWGIFAMGFTQAAIKNTGQIKIHRLIAAVIAVKSLSRENYRPGWMIVN